MSGNSGNWTEVRVEQGPVAVFTLVVDARLVDEAGYYLRSLVSESDRIRAWMQRHDPELSDGGTYSFVKAWQATVENPASFDRAWDHDMEPALRRRARLAARKE